MSWTTWLKIWNRDSASRPVEKNDSVMVAESLMSELDFQIHEAEELKFHKEQEARRQKTGVDYSWLVTTPPKTFKIPPGMRLELEQMASRVRPSECSTVLTSFRDALLQEPEVFEIPHIMRACIQHVLSRQPVPSETWVDWVGRRTQSLSNIRLRSSPKVLPVQEEMELQRKPQDKCPSSQSMPDFRCASAQGGNLDV
ncbi:protein RD3 [Lingula anatina]|uniref:Protein RD3 n=1 Tax=Lingula anatina TaxID=7574 RepID=A0A1S3H5T3_LINAN|nr:protein RD3 [Lingula anatina]XP_013381343.1 protein RD3 [Lingula anatina]|eukprot:XP_013381342.1 protein RD3 [Lingula anatina]